MAEHRVKSFAKPDEVIEFPNVKVRVVELGDITVGHFVNEPGWSWRECVRPTVGGEWCQARHLGMMISGRLGVELEDGTTFEFGPDDVFDIPPGHDGWVDRRRAGRAGRVGGDPRVRRLPDRESTAGCS